LGARTVPDCSIAIDNGIIQDIGPKKRIAKDYKFDDEIDARDRIVIPGLVDTHMHSYQVATKGQTCDSELLKWLRSYIFPWEGHLSRKRARACAELSYIEMAKSGTTCFSDFTSTRFTDEAFSVAEKIGLRANIGRTMMDYNAPKDMLEDTVSDIEDSRALIMRWHGRCNGRLRFMVTPRFDVTCSDELLVEAFALAKEYNLVFQTHAQENLGEVAFERKRFGVPAIKHLNKLGLLGSNVLLAHCVWLDKKDFTLLAKNNVKVAHCPGSNMYLASGIAPVPEMLKNKISVGLGSDVGAYGNYSMFEQMRLAVLLQKVHTLRPHAMDHHTVFSMATSGGAACVGLSKEIGEIRVGRKADLTLLDKRSLAFSPLHDVIAQVVYSAGKVCVSDVIVDGKVIVRDRQLTTINEEKTIRRASKALVS